MKHYTLVISLLLVITSPPVSLSAHVSNHVNSASDVLIEQKFQLNDLVQVVENDHGFLGSISQVIEPNVDRIEQYRYDHGCSSNCVIYSLATLHDQEKFECCQAYLTAAQIR